MRAHTLATLVAGASCACNHTPVFDLHESFSLRVEVSNRDVGPTKIDFLWVVDNSTSMCQEQAALTKSFDAFVSSLTSSFPVDARIAVTSVAAQCARPDQLSSGQGRFNRVPARTPNIACGEEVTRLCGGAGDLCDAGLDCAELGSCDSDASWKCINREYEVDGGECLWNSNDTVNQSCRRTCTSDADCQEAFGDAAFRCMGLNGPLVARACARAPATAGCPDVLPAFLEKNAVVDNSDLFRCVANVGVANETCFGYEEPLRSVQLALGIDPELTLDGERINFDQARDFLRADAYLVIVIISDEEDCSVEADEVGCGTPEHPPCYYHDMVDPDDNPLGTAVRPLCGLLPTTDAGGPLTPVAHFANRFKAIKDDPSKVIVAAIAGDSLAESEAERVIAREDYVTAKSATPTRCHATTPICESAHGHADFGGRLMAFTAAFGPNGTFENICGDEGIGPALGRIADSIIAVVNRMCLPKPILGQLRVTRTRDQVVTELREGQGPDTYTIVLTAEDCAVAGQPLPAISLWDRPLPEDLIDILYEGDPQLP